jgi:hypothetical protein
MAICVQLHGKVTYCDFEIIMVQLEEGPLLLKTVPGKSLRGGSILIRGWIW